MLLIIVMLGCDLMCDIVCDVVCAAEPFGKVE